MNWPLSNACFKLACNAASVSPLSIDISYFAWRFESILRPLGLTDMSITALKGAPIDVKRVLRSAVRKTGLVAWSIVIPLNTCIVCVFVCVCMCVCVYVCMCVCVCVCVHECVGKKI